MGVVPGDVVGRRTYMSTNTASRESKTRPILNLYSDECVRVVAAPYLGAVEEDPRVEPTSARGACLQEDVGEGRGDSV